MERTHREIDTRRNDAAFKMTIIGDNIEGRRRAAIDNNERSVITQNRAQCRHKTVGADLLL